MDGEGADDGGAVANGSGPDRGGGAFANGSSAGSEEETSAGVADGASAGSADGTSAGVADGASAGSAEGASAGGTAAWANCSSGEGEGSGGWLGRTGRGGTTLAGGLGTAACCDLGTGRSSAVIHRPISTSTVWATGGGEGGGAGAGLRAAQNHRKA